MRPRSSLSGIVAVSAALGLPAAVASAATAWSAVKTPAAGAPASIGGASAGCLVGARALALEGSGYHVVRAGRRRFFGHPALVAYVRALGRALPGAGIARILVADLAQPRGGPMPGAHASHQTGLDVDVLFELAPQRSRAAHPREPVEARTLVAADNQGVDPARWRPEHARLLSLAAAPAEVERIFVHPAIKRRLCRELTGERAWLQKLRPWFGHDTHFHVRLRCPADSPACEPGPELPAGDGCDDSLAWWFETEDGRPHAWREIDPRPPTAGDRERPPLPDACADVLRAR